MSDITRSTRGVRLSDLNWGYQIVHENQVLAAIRDTVGGPRRTEECSDEARRLYEKIARLYERLYSSSKRKPTQRQLNALASVIRRDTGKPRYWNTLMALHQRGVIVRTDANDFGYTGWKPNYA